VRDEHAGIAFADFGRTDVRIQHCPVEDLDRPAQRLIGLPRVTPGQASVAVVRNALGEKDFDAAWAEGAALATEEAIAYAQRGRGQRKRSTSGWGALTPTEAAAGSSVRKSSA
jgi:hypothetical protein